MAASGLPYFLLLSRWSSLSVLLSAAPPNSTRIPRLVLGLGSGGHTHLFPVSSNTADMKPVLAEELSFPGMTTAS